MDFYTGLSRLTHSALNLVLPLHCLGCQANGQLLCPTCKEALPPLNSPFCRICADPLRGGGTGACSRCQAGALAVDGIRAPLLMEGLIQDAIYHLKYRNLRALAPELAEILYRYLQTHPLPGDSLVPVPLHPRRLRRRGYNQALLLASELGKLSGMEVKDGLLKRIKDTPPQAEATSLERRRLNVADSFDCRGDVAGAKIILIDDVATSGSTLSACAEALKQAGASSVWGLTLTRQA